MFRYILTFIVVFFVIEFAALAGDNAEPIEREILNKAERTSENATIVEAPATFKITLPEKSKVAPMSSLLEELLDDEEASVEGTPDEAAEETAIETSIEDEPGIVLYASYAEAAKKARGTVLPSLDMLGYKSFTVFGGGVASVQMKIEFGVGVLEAGKQKLLISIANRLVDMYETSDGEAKEMVGKTLVFVAVAVMLGEQNGELPPEISINDDLYKLANKRKGEFEDDQPYFASPFAYYHWTEDLSLMCVRDRWLSKVFWPGERDYNDFEKALILSSVIASDPKLFSQYQFLHEFYTTLSNKTEVNSVIEYKAAIGNSSLLVAINDKDRTEFNKIGNAAADNNQPFQFFPEPRLEQIDLINRIVRNRETSASKIMENITTSIRAGQLDLTPDGTSGYLGYSEYALAAKLNPASTSAGGKIVYGDNYMLRMGSDFNSDFVQIDGIKPAISDGGIKPAFSVEPLPDYYLRMARALKYLNGVYRLALGAEYDNLHGIRKGGNPVTDSMSAEIEKTQKLYYGLYLESCMNLGINPQVGTSEIGDLAAALDVARSFVKDWDKDKDFENDVRDIYPISPGNSSDGKQGINYIVVIGIQPVEIIIEYDAEPNVIGEAEPTFGATSYTILVPIIEEIVIPGRDLFTRDAFIEVCDKYNSKEAIIAALERRGADIEGEEIDEDKTNPIFDKIPLDIFFMLLILLFLAIGITGYIIFTKIRDKKSQKYDNFDD